MNSQKCTIDHCVYVFDILKGALEGKIKNNSFPSLPPSIPNIQCPLFVTYHTHGDQLRGCIGTFGSEYLEKNLPRYALVAAFQDTRFDPIEAKELPNLSVGVSLLVNFEKAQHCRDWEVGKHGINIDFDESGRSYHATFLPEVAKEQGWDIDTTLSHLIRKAGYKGKLSQVDSKINVERYQSSKCEVTYKEYLELKQKN